MPEATIVDGIEALGADIVQRQMIKEFMRGLVQMQIFCPREGCGRILDMRDAINIEVKVNGTAATCQTICPTCYDTHVKGPFFDTVKKAATRLDKDIVIEVLDARILYKK